MQDKLLPLFGYSPQVAFTYFSYHISVSIFGVVDLSRNKKYAYITDKYQFGSKSANHTVNYLVE